MVWVWCFESEAEVGELKAASCGRTGVAPRSDCEAAYSGAFYGSLQKEREPTTRSSFALALLAISPSWSTFEVAIDKVPAVLALREM